MGHMLRYVVMNLYEDTPEAEQRKLISALEDIEGIKDIALDIERKEVHFNIDGAEPRVNALREACAGAGFSLGIRM